MSGVSRLSLCASPKSTYSGARARKYLRSGKLLRIKEMTGEDVVWGRCYPCNDTVICVTSSGRKLIFDRVCGVMLYGFDWKWLGEYGHTTIRKRNPANGRKWALPGG